MKTLAKWTVDDYHRMIEAGILENRRVELLEGEILEMTPEGPLHKYYEEKLADYLRSCLLNQALVREAAPIILKNSQQENSEPEPDISIVKLPRENYRDRHPGVDDIFWVIEVSDSTLTKDLDIKRKTYAAAGIQEYWIIDVKNRQLIIFHSPQDGDYLFRQDISQGNIQPLAFHNINVSVDRLFA
jgi:Uma2 family endonuclease